MILLKVINLPGFSGSARVPLFSSSESIRQRHLLGSKVCIWLCSAEVSPWLSMAKLVSLHVSPSLPAGTDIAGLLSAAPALLLILPLLLLLLSLQHMEGRNIDTITEEMFNCKCL